jgi:hypothetical protein
MLAVTRLRCIDVPEQKNVLNSLLGENLISCTFGNDELIVKSRCRYEAYFQNFVIFLIVKTQITKI